MKERLLSRREVPDSIIVPVLVCRRLTRAGFLSPKQYRASEKYGSEGEYRKQAGFHSTHCRPHCTTASLPLNNVEVHPRRYVPWLPKRSAYTRYSHNHASELLDSGAPLRIGFARLGTAWSGSRQTSYSHTIHGQDDEAARRWEE